jgi:lysylphosphatidylglycerol synthetase-like protein (DUF2156 family)
MADMLGQLIWNTATQITSAVGIGALAVVGMYSFARAAFAKDVLTQMTKKQTFALLITGMILFTSIALLVIVRVTGPEKKPPDPNILTKEERNQLDYCMEKRANPIAELACLEDLPFNFKTEVKTVIDLAKARVEKGKGTSKKGDNP